MLPRRLDEGILELRAMNENHSIRSGSNMEYVRAGRLTRSMASFSSAVTSTTCWPPGPPVAAPSSSRPNKRIKASGFWANACATPGFEAASCCKTGWIIAGFWAIISRSCWTCGWAESAARSIWPAPSAPPPTPGLGALPAGLACCLCWASYFK